MGDRIIQIIIREKIAFIDIDDTLSDSVPEFIALVNDILNTDFQKFHLTEYDLGILHPDITAEAIQRVISDDALLRRICVLPGALQGFSQFRSLGFRIILVTARLEAQRSITVTWLEANGFFYDELIMERPKHEVLDELVHTYEPEIVVVCEDSPKSLVLAEKGAKVFLFEQPWNMACIGDVVRVQGWYDLLARMTFYNVENALDMLRIA